MASQEHIAMLHDDDDDDDDDDDSSSTTSSSSDDDDDDDDSDDDDSSSSSSSEGDGPAVTAEATVMVTPKSATAAMEVSSPATERVVKQEESSISPAMPAKKRIKLGFTLAANSNVEDTVKLDVPSSADMETKADDKTSSTSSDLPTVEAKPIPTPSFSHESMSTHVTSSLPLRLKKKFKLPPHKAIMERASTEGTDITDDVVVKATVVESDDGGEDDAVAAVVEKPVPIKPKSSTTPHARGASTSPTSGARQQRRQANTGIKPVRLPPMSSPGLLVSVGPGPFREVANTATGLATPGAIFDHTMAAAGYTTENRSKKPHRGSSVKRVIDDMFEPNVKFCLGYPPLVPEDLIPPFSSDASANGGPRLSDRLLKAFRPTRAHPPGSGLSNGMGADTGINSNKTAEKRRKRKLPGFMEMAPLSLTIPYPEEYIQKRLEYIDKVNAREKAIVAYQEEELRLHKEKDRLEMAGKSVHDNFLTPSIVIPPLPEPPSAPRLRGIDGFDPEAFEDHHPIYLPKTGDLSLVAHLDKACFHVVDGRYFGLSSNSVADPNFVGPNAPGLAGLSLSGGTGLATANSGGGGSAGCTLLSAPSQSGASANANAKPRTKDAAKGKDTENGKTTGKCKDGKAVTKTKSGERSSTPAKSTTGKISKVPASSPNSGTSPPKKSKANGPPVNASAADLRKIMEDGGDDTEAMKTCIIRAAVYASRCGKHTRSFRAPNTKVYPDISKAFAVHAGVKPCERCKNNKQGAYHCRLRRKHKEPDYDGSDSTAVLGPLFKVPMEELVIRVIKKKPAT